MSHHNVTTTDWSLVTDRLVTRSRAPKSIRNGEFEKSKKEMASKLKTEVKKEPDIEVKVEEELNLKTEFKPEVKKLKREFKEEIKTEAEDLSFLSSSDFSKDMAQFAVKLSSLFDDCQGLG